MKDRITIALPKGRIYKECLPLLAAAGIEPTEDPARSRKLVIDTTMDGVEIVVIRGTDVPTYVQHGAADIGVAGKDVLMEHGGAGLNEVLDLQIAKCQLMTAGFEDFTMPTEAPLRVATKFVNCAKQYFAEQSQQIDIIKLYGSMELAPIVGLADLIVDLVDTGNTLKANKLVPMAHIADISSRLVVNSAAMKMKNAKIKRLVTDIDGAISS